MSANPSRWLHSDSAPKDGTIYLGKWSRPGKKIDLVTQGHFDVGFDRHMPISDDERFIDARLRTWRPRP